MTQAALKIRKNDIVKIIAGREKGKVGRVLKVDPDGGRIVVEKINMVKRHSKPSKSHPQGGVVEKEAPLAYSNVLLMCDKCNKPTRVRMLVEESGARSRACRRCGTPIEAKKR